MADCNSIFLRYIYIIKLVHFLFWYQCNSRLTEFIVLKIILNVYKSFVNSFDLLLGYPSRAFLDILYSWFNWELIWHYNFERFSVYNSAKIRYLFLYFWQAFWVHQKLFYFLLALWLVVGHFIVWFVFAWCFLFCVKPAAEAQSLDDAIGFLRDHTDVVSVSTSYHIATIQLYIPKFIRCDFLLMYPLICV